jgi:hypothetical protein
MTPQPTVGEIAAAAEANTSRDQLQSQQRKRVYVSDRTREAKRVLLAVSGGRP